MPDGIRNLQLLTNLFLPVYPNAIYENLGTSVHADLMVWEEINLPNKGGLKMNLAFLISFMTFHFFLNLAFLDNFWPIRTLILIYFIFFEKNLKMCASQPAQTEHFQNQASQTIFLTLTFFDFISLWICHIF